MLCWGAGDAAGDHSARSSSLMLLPHSKEDPWLQPGLPPEFWDKGLGLSLFCRCEGVVLGDVPFVPCGGASDPVPSS